MNERGFFHLLATNFFRQFLGFGTVLLVAKLLSPAELGKIRIIQSWASIFMILAGFGYSSAVLKYCSEARGDEEKRSILKGTLRASCVTVLASLGALAISAASGVLSETPGIPFWLFVYALSVPFMVFTEILNMFLLALKRVREMALSLSIIRIQSFLLIVIATAFLGFRGFVLFTVLAYAMGLMPPIRHLGTGFLHAPNLPMPSGFHRFAAWSVLANACNTIGQMSDVLILDRFSSAREEIGYYALATVFVLGATQVTGTVQAILSPYFSERSKDLAWVRSQVNRNLKRLVPLSVLVSGGVYTGAFLLVRFFYGEGYSSSLDYLGILLIKYVLWSSTVILSVAIFGLGHVRYNFGTGAIAAPIAILVSYLLFKRIGIAGVAWGQVIYASLVLILQVGFFRHAMQRGRREG